HRSDRGTHRRGILAPSSKDPEAPDRGRGASAENGVTAQIAPIVVSAVKRTANREGSVLARDASRVSLPIIGFYSIESNGGDQTGGLPTVKAHASDPTVPDAL